MKVNLAAKEELDQMKHSMPFKHVPRSSLKVPMDVYLRLVLLNVNSFLPHQQSIPQENLISHSHIACFVKTWLRPSDTLPIYDDLNHLRNDSQDLCRGRNGEISILTVQPNQLLPRNFHNCYATMDTFQLSRTLPTTKKGKNK